MCAVFKCEKKVVEGTLTYGQHKYLEKQKVAEKTAKGSRFAQQQCLHRDNQNDNAKSSTKTKHCLTRIWLWGWYFLVRHVGLYYMLGLCSKVNPMTRYYQP